MPLSLSTAMLASSAPLLFPFFSLYTCCSLCWGGYKLSYLHRVAFSSRLRCPRPCLTTQFTGLTTPRFVAHHLAHLLQTTGYNLKLSCLLIFICPCPLGYQLWGWGSMFCSLLHTVGTQHILVKWIKHFENREDFLTLLQFWKIKKSFFKRRLTLSFKS